jgi:hypothetical protein
MELFIPGLATLLIMGLIVFLIVPRLGAPILAILSILILIYAVYNHIQLFSFEYKYSTWQDRLKEYASFIIVGALILGILLYLGFLFATKGSEALPVASVETPTNMAQANEAVVNATKSIANTVTNVVNTVKNAVGMNATSNNTNKQGVLANLGNILKTPFANKRPNNRPAA